MELSFEYLLSKDRLQWISVDSPQVIFLSLCLQSMMEELMRKQRGSSCTTSCDQQVNIPAINDIYVNVTNYNWESLNK